MQQVAPGISGALTSFVALFALVLASTPALAQQGPGGRRMLSSDERLASGDRETMRAEMMKLMEETDKQYAEVLTEEQMNTYREMRQQRMRQGRPPPPQGDR
jgi:hypothetical protein